MTENFANGIDSPYYTDKGVRLTIDEALRKCAVLRTQIGTKQLRDSEGHLIDDKGEAAAKAWVMNEENRILGGVVELDPDFIETLMYSEDKFDTI